MNFLIEILRQFLNRMLQLLSLSRSSISNTLNIYIKTNTGRKISVKLEPQWDIKNVKELVAPQLGLQPDEMKIIFAGKELSDATTIQECDLGQQSILHAIRLRPQRDRQRMHSTLVEEQETGAALNSNTANVEEHAKLLNDSMADVQQPEERYSKDHINETERTRKKAQFFVHCSECQKLCRGKLRVRCSICRGGAFTVYTDPQNWSDVLKPGRIHGCCESQETPCVDPITGEPPLAEFYFKCAEHISGCETDYAAPLNLVKCNINDVPCLACTDVCDIVLIFPCAAKHVTCIDCFLQYCRSRLMERQFMPHVDIGYTLSCPAACENSYIEEIHHFKLMERADYDRYQRFACEEYVLQAGGVLCPQPGCGMGLLADVSCKKITCQNGCGFVFCRDCLQGFHLGDCLTDTANTNEVTNCEYSIDPNRAAEARWDDASKVAIKILTKPCPKCRTPTERDGGCMHMECTRAGCGYEWCWICQTEWTRECMGAHWFG